MIGLKLFILTLFWFLFLGKRSLDKVTDEADRYFNRRFGYGHCSMAFLFLLQPLCFVLVSCDFDSEF